MLEKYRVIAVPKSRKRGIGNMVDEEEQEEVEGLGEGKTKQQHQGAAVYKSRGFNPSKRKAIEQGGVETTASNISSINTAAKFPYDSVQSLANTITAQIDSCNQVLAVPSMTTQKYKDALSKVVATTKTNLYGEKFMAYIVKERTIFAKGFSKETEEVLIRANLEGCLGEGDWMGKEIL